MIRCNLRVLIAQHETNTGTRLTYRDLADALDLSPTTVSNWANNKMKGFEAETLSKMCAFFDVGIDGVLTYFPEGAEMVGD